MKQGNRVDRELVVRGICESRELAQAYILSGTVYINDTKVQKASEVVMDHDKLYIKEPVHPYVSRGGLKLEKAFSVFPLDVKDKVALDIGASTGGFTDVLLRNGARHVYTVDVGYGQMDWRIRNDARVTVMERMNARYLEPEQFSVQPSVSVIDVSFISLKLIIPAAARVMGHKGIMLLLIKPQFEAGKEKVGKKGVIKDITIHTEVITSVQQFAKDLGWTVRGLDFSPIQGAKGNIEFLMLISKGADESLPNNTTDVFVAIEVVKKSHKEFLE